MHTLNANQSVNDVSRTKGKESDEKGAFDGCFYLDILAERGVAKCGWKRHNEISKQVGLFVFDFYYMERVGRGNFV